LCDVLVLLAVGMGGLLVGGGSLLDLSPGRTTVQAVDRGAVLMLRGFIESQVRMAPTLLGGAFALFLTGGDAEMVGALSVEAHVVSDLVFVGLAIACP
jgi:type III pantothenate kinase